MRELTGHITNPANDKLEILVVDDPGAGGANHAYIIHGAMLTKNPSQRQVPETREDDLVILFQNGPIPTAGVNGVTQEVLLEIVADRLRSFQAGGFACRENALALTKIEEAQHWLQQRTLARMRRGVEGTNIK